MFFLDIALKIASKFLHNVRIYSLTGKYPVDFEHCQGGDPKTYTQAHTDTHVGALRGGGGSPGDPIHLVTSSCLFYFLGPFRAFLVRLI